MSPARLYTLWVAAPRTGATLPLHPRPRDTWDLNPLTHSCRRPRVVLRSRATDFFSLHHGHTRGTLCFTLAPRPLGAAHTAYVALATPTPCPLFCISRATRSLFVTAYHVRPLIAILGPPPPRAPDAGRGGALRRGPFPMFLIDIAQTDDAYRLLRDLHTLKDDALEEADEAMRAPDPALCDLCNALRWAAANGATQVSLP